MARRTDGSRGYLVVALVLAALLWVVAHGSRDVEKGFDVPVVFKNVPAELVITERNSDVVNVRVLGSRAALRNLGGEALEYAVDVSEARRGSAEFEVEQSPIDVPRGAQVRSRSPSRLDVKFERRGTKVMQVRADLSGDPAEGFRVANVEIEPPRVSVTGARREVLRLNEAVTEAIDIGGVDQTVEHEVKLNLGRQHVWVEQPDSVIVRVQVEPVEEG